MADAIWLKDLGLWGLRFKIFEEVGRIPACRSQSSPYAMAVIQGMPPQATSNAEADTAPDADVTPGTSTIPTTTICELWAEMSPAQALGFDGDRVPLGQRGEGPHRPDSLIGPLAQQPAIRTVTILVGGLRYTDRDDILDIYEALDRDCSGALRAQWRRTIRPRSRCCMNGEEIRIDHATREVYKYSELRSTLSGFEETAVLQW